MIELFRPRLFCFDTHGKHQIIPKLVELKTATETVPEAPESSSGAAGVLNKTCVPFCPTQTMVADNANARSLAGCVTGDIQVEMLGLVTEQRRLHCYICVWIYLSVLFGLIKP